MAMLLASRCIELTLASKDARGAATARVAAARVCAEAPVRTSHLLSRELYLRYGRCASARDPANCASSRGASLPPLVLLYRDPLAKWLSNLYYWGRKSAAFRANARLRFPQNWTAADVIALDETYKTYSDEGVQVVGRGHGIDAALRNLRSDFIVGDVSRFDALVVWLAMEQNWSLSSVHYKRYRDTDPAQYQALSGFRSVAEIASALAPSSPMPSS